MLVQKRNIVWQLTVTVSIVMKNLSLKYEKNIINHLYAVVLLLLITISHPYLIVTQAFYRHFVSNKDYNDDKFHLLIMDIMVCFLTSRKKNR